MSVFGENGYELLSGQRKVDDTYEGSLSFSLLPLFHRGVGWRRLPMIVVSDIVLAVGMRSTL